MLGGGGEVGEPAGFGAVIEFCQVALGVPERGQVTGLRVRIEAGGRFVPTAMSAEMDFGIEPVAPADDGPPAELSGEWRVASDEWALGAEVVAGDTVFDGEGNERVAEGVAGGIVQGTKAE